MLQRASSTGPGPGDAGADRPAPAEPLSDSCRLPVGILRANRRHRLLIAIEAEIRAGRRHRDDIPDDVRAAAAGLLHQGPSLTRFIVRIQSKIHPDYRFSPWLGYGKFLPVTERVMNEIAAVQNPGGWLM
ncbi:hypothetical protein [Dactylosporangium sp. CA-233914]|uniref:hypothetical protein n=1 Tax=Dactylosporangium sp. CA-233914 TaxID=3239934 RepID=UPI003D94018F